MEEPYQYNDPQPPVVSANQQVYYDASHPKYEGEINIRKVLKLRMETPYVSASS